MLVQLDILLTGGHRHSVICDDGDPMILGLLSSLPGANIDGQPTSDGLIQLDLPLTGKRLFIPPSSLIGVEMRQILSPDERKRLIGGPALQNASIPEGSSAPAPAVIMKNLLPQKTVFGIVDAIEGHTESELTLEMFGKNGKNIKREMLTAIQKSRNSLGIPDILRTELKVSLEAASNGLRWPVETTPSDMDYILKRTLIAVFSITTDGNPPLELTLQDRAVKHSRWVKGDRWRKIELHPNNIVIFPGNVHFEIAGGDQGLIVLGELEADFASG